MADDRETCVERIQGNAYCTVYTGERKFVNKLNQLKEQYPDEVNIKDFGDGFVGGHVPYNWFKFVGPPKSVNLTEEQRQARAERMRQVAKENKTRSIKGGTRAECSEY